VSTIDPTTIPATDLAPMLRAWSAGSYPSEAAVGLLIAHGRWLRRRDFLARLVDAVDDGWGPRGSVLPMATVDWEAVPDFTERVAASSSELTVLRLAASLAGVNGRASVMELTSFLDDTNGRHVLDAVAHRCGWHERGTSHLVTGRQGDDQPVRATATSEPLPTFEDLRGYAYRSLGDAADWLRTGYRRGGGPSPEAATAVHRAFLAITAAKDALDDAADAQRRARARHRAPAVALRAEARSAQYPEPLPETRHG
jgi:hypothetical protein